MPRGMTYKQQAAKILAALTPAEVGILGVAADENSHLGDDGLTDALTTVCEDEDIDTEAASAFVAYGDYARN